MTVKERIIVFQESLSMSVREFELSVNLANGSLKKVKNISGDTLEEICRIYPNVSAEWLLREEGEMLRTLHERLEESTSKEYNYELDKLEKLVNRIVDKRIKEKSI